MQSEQLTIAHSLYAFYESLPDNIQQSFFQKIFQKHLDKLENLAFYFACQEAKDENEFLSDTECRDFINAN